MARLNAGGRETGVHRIDLIRRRQDESEVKPFGIVRWRLPTERSLVTQDQGEAMPVGHDGNRLALLVDHVKIEELLEQVPCLGEFVDAQV